MTSIPMPDEETLAAAAWVCYVHSLDGRTSLKVTDVPNWTSDFQREKYLRRAREIFAGVSAHQQRIEEEKALNVLSPPQMSIMLVPLKLTRFGEEVSNDF